MCVCACVPRVCVVVEATLVVLQWSHDVHMPNIRLLSVTIASELPLGLFVFFNNDHSVVCRWKD